MSKFVVSGEIYMCDYGQQNGSIQGGLRPCVIVDNPKACAYSPIIHCCPLTTEDKNNFPLHYKINQTEYPFLSNDSIVLCEQYGVVDKRQLKDKIGKIGLAALYGITELCRENLPF